MDGPVWMYSATFDVSRISDIAITTYLRTAQPGSKGSESGSGRGTPGGGGGQSSGDKGVEDMGNSDLCLGSVRFTPDLESGVSCSLALGDETEKG